MTLWTDPEIERLVLVDPVRAGCNELRVLSGYASPHIVYDLLGKSEAERVSLAVTVGMVGADGISLGAHRGFVALQSLDYPGRVRVDYVIRGRPVHAKLFVWSRDGVPQRAFAGSANCTSNGLHGGYRELVVSADPIASMAFIDAVAADALPCDDPTFPDDLIFLSTRTPRNRLDGEMPQQWPWEGGMSESVEISLLTPRTDTGVAYGLNWGQRDGRDPDQAYLPVPAVVAKSGFLPPRGKRFTLLSSDGQALSAVVAQDGNKAIETPDSNAKMGRFIRARLGLPSGFLIQAADLERAGCTGYRLYKVDEETFAIEFGRFGEGLGRST